LEFEFSPIWQGKRVKNGIEHINGGGVTVYAGGKPDTALENLFYESVDILKRHNLISQDRTQDSDDFIVISKKGNDIYVDEDSMDIAIDRPVEELRKRYIGSVFLIEVVKNDGTISNGTAFLIRNSTIITCRHCLEDIKSWKIHFNTDTSIEGDQFIINSHAVRDVCILKFRSETMTKLFEGLNPFPVNMAEPNPGCEVVTIGYPRVAYRQPTALIEAGSFMGMTRDYKNLEYITVSNKIRGGCSGGPVLNKTGFVIGIITELTENSPDTSANNAQQIGDTIGHATPIRYAF